MAGASLAGDVGDEANTEPAAVLRRRALGAASDLTAVDQLLQMRASSFAARPGLAILLTDLGQLRRIDRPEVRLDARDQQGVAVDGAGVTKEALARIRRRALRALGSTQA